MKRKEEGTLFCASLPATYLALLMNWAIKWQRGSLTPLLKESIETSKD
jgi:hypothetical protein